MSCTIQSLIHSLAGMQIIKYLLFLINQINSTFYKRDLEISFSHSLKNIINQSRLCRRRVWAVSMWVLLTIIICLEEPPKNRAPPCCFLILLTICFVLVPSTNPFVSCLSSSVRVAKKEPLLLLLLPPFVDRPPHLRVRFAHPAPWRIWMIFSLKRTARSPRPRRNSRRPPKNWSRRSKTRPHELPSQRKSERHSLDLDQDQRPMAPKCPPISSNRWVFGLLSDLSFRVPQRWLEQGIFYNLFGCCLRKWGYVCVVVRSSIGFRWRLQVLYSQVLRHSRVLHTIHICIYVIYIYIHICIQTN